MRDLNIVNGGLSRVTPTRETGVSEGAIVGSNRWLLGASGGEGPSIGVSAVWRFPIGLRRHGGEF